MDMNHGSLFSGIGGFDLAAEWAGWNNVFHCEINPFGSKVLKYYWPKAISYDDITKTDFTIHRGNIDILTGGFPCQPFSLAGKRKGTEDDRNLWPEYYRAIKEIQPTWVVGENVPGIINWSAGMVFDQVQADLENEGYEVRPVILPACAVGAPHRRDRTWFVAYSPSNGYDAKSKTRYNAKRSNNFQPRAQRFSTFKGFSNERITTYTKSQQSKRMQPEQREFSQQESQKLRGGNSKNCSKGWDEWPTQSPICSGNDGISSRLDGITFPKWRNESIKAYGNAIVPQVIYQIFKAIMEYEEATN